MNLEPDRIYLLRGSDPDWRGAVRRWAGRFVNSEELVFAYEEFGKPYFQNCPGLKFSVTHTRDTLCAVFSRGDVGVDSEFRDRRTRAMSLAERYFQAKETAWLGNQPEADRREIFLNLWTAKEACVKLTGEGIYRGLSKCQVDTSVQPANAMQNGRRVFLKQYLGNDGLIVTVAAWNEFQLECLEP